MADYKFCPQCKEDLKSVMENGEEYQSCTNDFCSFVFYDNPIPVAAAIVPVENKIVLVQRGVMPDIGGWCLPCGYINKNEDPKKAAIREVKEETGLDVVITGILDTTKPLPHGGNRIVLFYEAIVNGGELKAGDDALDAKLFHYHEMPEICFGSHRMVVDKYFNF